MEVILIRSSFVVAEPDSPIILEDKTPVPKEITHRVQLGWLLSKLITIRIENRRRQ